MPAEEELPALPAAELPNRLVHCPRLPRLAAPPLPDLVRPGARLSVTGSGPRSVRPLPFTVSVIAPGLPSWRVTFRRSLQVLERPWSMMPWKTVAPLDVVRSAQQASLTAVREITTAAAPWRSAGRAVLFAWAGCWRAALWTVITGFRAATVAVPTGLYATT